MSIKLVCGCGNVMDFVESEEVGECEYGNGDEVYAKSNYIQYDLYAHGEVLIIHCQECNKSIWTHT